MANEHHATRSAAVRLGTEVPKGQIAVDPSSLRVALVHDQLYTIGGAERVLAEILHCFPQADVYGLFDILDNKQRMQLVGERSIQTTFLQRLPFLRNLHKHYMMLMPLAIEQLDLRDYDLIVSSSYLVAKGVIVHPDQLHVCYLHSPMRYAWDQQAPYLKALGATIGVRRTLARLALHYLRLWDVRSSHSVDVFVANSAFVARRALKSYRRGCHVIHPPVDTARMALGADLERQDDVFVTVSRLVPQKRIDLMLDAFRDLPDCRLVVVGSGPLERTLAKQAPPNVTFTGWLDDAEGASWLRRAAAFLFVAEEDFGIAPVEAQACGCPVIAFARGGAAETITDYDQNPAAATGLLFHEQSAAALARTIRRFARIRRSLRSEACKASARRFSREAFRTRFLDLVRGELERWAPPEPAWAALPSGQDVLLTRAVQ